MKWALIASALWGIAVVAGVLWQIEHASPLAHGALVYVDTHEYVNPAAELMGATGAASREVFRVVEVDTGNVLALFVLPLAALWAALGWRARGRPEDSLEPNS
ncbi:MAG: hypothetical protein Q4G70_11265 [Pseudomonadota bacterium]|nr:hypothetical protein [Pseudomonadota bacterium]